MGMENIYTDRTFPRGGGRVAALLAFDDAQIVVGRGKPQVSVAPASR